MNEIEQTREWIDRAVIGLNLCPFAKSPQIKGLVRYSVTKTRKTETLLQALSDQLLYLESTAPQICETSVLIHPNVLQNFMDYNDFLDDADQLLERLGLEGSFQIASFHPQYQFACSSADDIGNYTNRSPYPMLHILREASIEKALQGYDDADAAADAIVQRNQETLKKLGKAGWSQLWE